MTCRGGADRASAAQAARPSSSHAESSAGEMMSGTPRGSADWRSRSTIAAPSRAPAMLPPRKPGQLAGQVPPRRRSAPGPARRAWNPSRRSVLPGRRRSRHSPDRRGHRRGSAAAPTAARVQPRAHLPQPMQCARTAACRWRPGRPPRPWPARIGMSGRSKTSRTRRASAVRRFRRLRGRAVLRQRIGEGAGDDAGQRG